MKVYLAHNFAARDVLANGVTPAFVAAGHEITSRWLFDDRHLLHDAANDELSAVHDLEDVERADAFVMFTSQYGDRPGRGKFVELGYAIRAGKRVVLVGSIDDPGYAGCVFYRLPSIRHAETFEKALQYLVREGKTKCTNATSTC